ncbi:hypothetical protein [Mycoplasma sp. Z1473D]
MKYKILKFIPLTTIALPISLVVSCNNTTSSNDKINELITNTEKQIDDLNLNVYKHLLNQTNLAKSNSEISKTIEKVNKFNDELEKFSIEIKKSEPNISILTSSLNELKNINNSLNKK